MNFWQFCDQHPLLFLIVSYMLAEVLTDFARAIGRRRTG